ncbi:hypothetical protein [Clostridioides sp. ES-S-0001-03]|nr:hypothetical protein [Clostridioides sp. ES-S-0001-03]
MNRKGKILKICGWCGRTFLSDNNRKIDYCCEECKSRREKDLEEKRRWND